MKTITQKKDCIRNLLSQYQNEFHEEIERLDTILKQEEYDNFLTNLSTFLAKTHADLLVKIQLCQNNFNPEEIQSTNIN
jgi:hypothetical protein